jgi:hypothetical protein
MPIGHLSNSSLGASVGAGETPPGPLAKASEVPSARQQPKDATKQVFKVIDQWSARTGADVTELDARPSIDKLYRHLLLKAADDPSSKPELVAFLTQAREAGRPLGMTLGLPRPGDVDLVVNAVLQTPHAASVSTVRAPSDRLDLAGLDVHQFVANIGDPASNSVGARDFQQYLRDGAASPFEKGLAEALLQTVFDAGPWDRQELIVALQNKVAADEALQDGIAA